MRPFVTYCVAGLCWMLVAAGGQASSTDWTVDEEAVAGEEQLVLDPSFEEGSPNPYWFEFSSNFGTPLCTRTNCGGAGGGTGARTGIWWVWFGGINDFEEGRVGQRVRLPSLRGATLKFWLEIPQCSGDLLDFLEVFVDDSEVFRVRGDDDACGDVGYVEVEIDIEDELTGPAFDLELSSTVRGNNPVEVTSFFVDDFEVTVDAPEIVLTLDLPLGCPGDGEVTVTGGAPEGDLYLVSGTEDGTAMIPDGAPICPGAVTAIGGAPLVLGPFSFDENGAFAQQLSPAPLAACGRLFQALDVATCTFSPSVPAGSR